ncbi:hypothetical protein DNTS_004972 [Danionella cerebrum]|uniref:Delta-like protein n=1 Tax=Danionella cerebrum TaxID=2873325 RepID=A0A553QNH5_9TELE|nr:hypothetical protein DNTS_004972 [Danionella translucida]
MGRLLIAALLCVLISQGFCSGVFELKLQEFLNKKGLTGNANCCKASSEADQCECKTFFRICLKHYQANVSPDPPCTYGGAVTPVLGSNSFQVPDSFPDSTFANPVQFAFGFTWPGTFSLIIEALHTESNEDLSTENPERLISRMTTQRHLTVGEEWSQDLQVGGRTELKYSYRFVCDEHYYGEGCSVFCRPRDDTFGHFTCGERGEIICNSGWKGQYCTERGSCRVKVDNRAAVLHWHHVHQLSTLIYATLGRYGEGLFVFLDAMKIMDIVTNLVNANAEWDLVESIVMTASAIQAVCMAPANSHGNATAKRAGGASFVTKISITAHITNHARMGPLAPTLAREATPAHAVLVSLGKAVRSRSTNALAAHAEMEEAALCTCPPGFYGRNCELSAMTCADGPCFNGGRCADNPDGGYFCQCPMGYAGFNCEKKIDHCSSNPCTNGAQCLDLVDSYLCQCPEGFSGTHCEDNIDECATYPCQNGGTCQDGLNDYTCTCPPGYTDKNCTSAVQKCAHNPCHNGATCHERDGRYVCACTPSYGGRNCQFLLPENPQGQAIVEGADKRYSYEEGDEDFPWMAVCAGIILVLLILIGGAVFIVYIRLKLQQRSQHVESHSEIETMNNLTNNCSREKDLTVCIVGTTQVKNINKKVDFHGDCMGGEKNGFKPRYSLVDYNLVHELKHEDLGKEELEKSESTKCEAPDSDSEEKQRNHLKSDSSERKQTDSLCKDTKYQSVFVLTDEKDECIIATEV